MTTVTQDISKSASKPAAPRPLGDAITSWAIVIIPIALALICFAAGVRRYSSYGAPLMRT